MRYLNVFRNVLLTKGANSMLISDLQTNTSEMLPLQLGIHPLMEPTKININYYEERISFNLYDGLEMPLQENRHRC